MFIIDVDGTVADTTHREKHLQRRDLTPGRRWSAFFRQDLVAKDRIIPEAQVLNTLMKDGADVAILTARPERLQETTTDWMQKHFPSFNPDVHKVIHKPPKEKLPAPEWKARVASDLAGDKPFIFIDDDEANLQTMKSVHPEQATTLHPSDGWNFIRTELEKKAQIEAAAPEAQEDVENVVEPTYTESIGIPFFPDTGIVVDDSTMGEEDYTEDEDI